MSIYVVATLNIHDPERYNRYEARRWATSPEYREIAADRHAASSASVFFVEGFWPWKD